MNDYIEITITKPLSGEYVAIRDKYLNQAKRLRRVIKITTPTSTHYTTYKDWMKGAKKIEKEFKIPGKPMVLYSNYANNNKPPREKLEDISPDRSVMERLKSEATKQGWYKAK